jgi:hypothetical protein
MVKAQTDKPKRGRPATGQNAMYGARFSPTLIEKIDKWAARQGITRSEAIRRLVERGLTAESKQ